MMDIEPQINADERRYNPVTVFAHKNPVTDFDEITHSKEKPRCRTRMTRIGRIFTDTNPCASVSSVQSVFYRDASAFIHVHLLLIRTYLKNQSVVYIRINRRVHREHRDAFKKSLCPLCSLWFYFSYRLINGAPTGKLAAGGVN